MLGSIGKRGDDPLWECHLFPPSVQNAALSGDNCGTSGKVAASGLLNSKIKIKTLLYYPDEITVEFINASSGTVPSTFLW
jgi:hypothetical protein